ncbi:MAG: hypothetical protein AAFR52_15325 [Pseudomonadota bacterium]
MATYDIGDLVVLKSGSMRMTVESTEDESVSVVWCHEGNIGRDSFHTRLLNKWEVREDHRGGHHDRGGDRGGRWNDRGGDRGGRDDDRGDRGGHGNRFGGRYSNGGDRDDRGGDRRDRDGGGGGDRGGWGDRPPRKTGWDGKPRDKKYFRKDD